MGKNLFADSSAATEVHNHKAQILPEVKHAHFLEGRHCPAEEILETAEEETAIIPHPLLVLE